MNRQHVFLIVVIVGSVIAASHVGLGATLAQLRHEDPAAAAVESDPAAVFNSYRIAASRLTSWQFQEGRRLVLQLNQANLPPEILGVVRDLNSLMIQEGSILEAADEWLREAERLIRAGKLEAARPVLAQLGVYARRGDLLFDDIVAGIENLARRSNVATLPPDAPERRAYTELRRLAARAKALLVTYKAIANNPQSAATVGRLLPYETTISLSVPEIAYPARPFTVVGTVLEKAPKPSDGRVLTLVLNSDKLAEFPLGQFRENITLPDGILSGEHLITASVSAQNRYLGASVQRTLQVIRAMPVIAARAPAYAFAPGRASLNGSVKSRFGAVTDAWVEVRIGNTIYRAQTTKSGEFAITLHLPATLNLVGPERFSLRLSPQEPWHAATEAVFQVFIINFATASVAVLLFTVGGAIYLRSRRRRKRVGAAAVPSLVGLEPDQAGTRSPVTVREQILSLYLRALSVVQAMTGLDTFPSTTLRELLLQAQPKLETDTFAQMTRLVEGVLYSARPITPALLEQSRHLFGRLEGEFAGAIR